MLRLPIFFNRSCHIITQKSLCVLAEFIEPLPFDKLCFTGNYRAIIRCVILRAILKIVLPYPVIDFHLDIFTCTMMI